MDSYILSQEDREPQTFGEQKAKRIYPPLAWEPFWEKEKKIDGNNLLKFVCIWSITQIFPVVSSELFGGKILPRDNIFYEQNLMITNIGRGLWIIQYNLSFLQYWSLLFFYCSLWIVFVTLLSCEQGNDSYKIIYFMMN